MTNWIFKNFLQNNGTATNVTGSDTFIIMFTMHLTRLFLDLIVFLKHYHNCYLEIGKPFTC